MRTLYAVVGLLVVASLIPVSGYALGGGQAAPLAMTYVTSNITVDTTWTLAGSPYYVTRHIDVEPGVTLTIEPGVRVYMGAKTYLHVRDGASLIARGTPSQHIVFSRYPGGRRWKKIWFHGGSTSYLRYVEFLDSGADAADENAAIHYSGTGTHIFNMSEIRDGDQFGIVAEGSVDLTIAGSLFRNVDKRDIYIDENASVTITGSTLDKSTEDKGGVIWLRNSGAQVSVTDSNILGSGTDYGIDNDSVGHFCIDAQRNWWGGSGGPEDPSGAGGACGLGTNGGGGTWVTDGVDYRNWRSSSVARIGITTQPEAAFTISPDSTVGQQLGTTYTFDASSSTDAEDYASSLDFCWDWDNDGSCDTSWSSTATATYSYTVGGWMTVRLRVRDTDGDIGEATQAVMSGYPPTATFTYTQPTWFQVVFDASGSSDTETTDKNQLVAGWDWEGDGVWNTTGLSVTQNQTHTYSHQGRYWPTLVVEDTDGLTGTALRSVDIVPLPVTTTITGGGGALTSTDGTAHIAMYTDTVSGDVISDGMVITHTPWLTVPQGVLTGDFTYQGFNLAAHALTDGQPIDEVSGTYTITLGYDTGYFADVLRFPAFATFEDQLTLYWWSDVLSSWQPVTSTVQTTQQVMATTGFLGDFALVLDVRRIYLPDSTEKRVE